MAYIGPEPNPGQNREVDDISSGFNGSEVNFTLQVNSQNVSPGSSNAIIVSLGGVVQNPGTDYTVAASTLTFTTAPASGLAFFGLVLGQQVDTADANFNDPVITGDLSIADKIVHTGDTNTAIRFSAADTVSVETAGTAKASINSVGKLTLTSTETSNSNPVVLNASGQSYFQVITPNNTIGGIKFGDVDDGDVGAIKYGHGDNRMQFDVNGSEKIRILSGGGITFNGDTATANAIDDYEEGIFTPLMTFDTLQSAPSGSFTGQYQKVGHTVYFHARFGLTNEGSGINSIHLANLPFTPNVSSYTHPIATFYAEGGVATGDNNHMIFGKLITDRYKFRVCDVHSSSSVSTHFHMNMTNNSAIFGLYGFYFTSS